MRKHESMPVGMLESMFGDTPGSMLTGVLACMLGMLGVRACWLAGLLGGLLAGSWACLLAGWLAALLTGLLTNQTWMLDSRHHSLDPPLSSLKL